jgi:undecaprenyl-diphosphatase
MTYFHAFVLGIIQGLTEFIPVSSTAHLLITQTILGISADNAMFSFLVILQLGTLVSLFAFYWKDLLAIVRATLDFRRATPERNLGIYIVVATIPALIAGYLLRDAVEALFTQPMLQASIRLFSAAILLTLAETLTRKNRTLDSMTWLDALVVGLFQIISLFPGASRSGTTISGGMFRGFDRPCDPAA